MKHTVVVDEVCCANPRKTSHSDQGFVDSEML
jgi:hypothetical protein